MEKSWIPCLVSASKNSKFTMDQDLPSNSDIAKSNGILRLFIGFVQREYSNKLEECSLEDCINVLNWLSSNQMDVNKKDWFLAEDGHVISQLLAAQENLRYGHRRNLKEWIWELRNELSILLKCNGNIQFVDENGKTILHVFLENFGWHKYKMHLMVEYLMEEGISMQAVDENGNTPLHNAAKLEELNLIPIMMKNYTNINACNNQGDTVLHILCSVQFYQSEVALMEECVQSILAKGADMNMQNKDGWTPAHFAAKFCHSGVLKIFLCSGSNWNLLTNDSENPLLLYSKYAWHTCDEDFLIKLYEFLINGGCDVNATDRYGYSPLHYACKYRKNPTDSRSMIQEIWFRFYTERDKPFMSLIKTLVKADAAIDAKTLDGATPFLLAVIWRASAAEHLIELGANVACRENVFGFTALHMAALQFQCSVLSCVLQRELLDVNDGGIYGITALHLASVNENLQAMEMLIARGADVNCRDNATRSTILHFVVKEVSEDINLVEHISRICGVERMPSWANDEDFPKIKGWLRMSIVEMIVRNGADVNAKDVYGRTPLHLATMYEEKKSQFSGYNKDRCATEGILRYGAWMDLQDVEGNTPLHNALKSRHEKALKCLLEFGVDVNDADTSRLILNCEENQRNMVFEYLVKLKVAELPVSSAYGSPTMDPKFMAFYGRCATEIRNMKAFLVDETTSIYDFLHMGWRRRISFEQKLPDDLEKKFPLYASIIQSGYRAALQRKTLYEPAKSGWYRITEVELPEVCVERILAHLKNRYLDVLADGLFEDGS